MEKIISPELPKNKKEEQDEVVQEFSPSESKDEQKLNKKEEHEIDIRLEKLEKEFDSQLEHLVEKGFWKIISPCVREDEFRAQILPLKEKLREIAEEQQEIKEGHIPFVLVLHRTKIRPAERVCMMRLNDKESTSEIKTLELNYSLYDNVEIPAESRKGLAYLITDIEDGKETQDESAIDARQSLEKDGRSALTIEEGMALAGQHPEILEDHNLIFSGSFYKDHTETPHLTRGPAGQAHFGVSDVRDKDPKYGTPSCSKRMSL